MNLPRFSVRHPVTVAMFVCGVLLLGLVSLNRLGTDLLPNLDSPRISVALESGNKSPREMEDSYAEQAMRTLAECGITSGETGAAALAGLEAVIASSNPLELGKETTALVISTEGATDPAAYERIVGRKPT